MKRVLVSVSNDISNDQRLERTCSTLHKNNYNVTVIGRKKKDSQTINFQFKTKRLNLLFSRGFLFYACFNFRLFFILFFSKKDILFANDLDTLLPNYLVSKLQNKPLVFDSHELFSEVPELVNKTFSKKVWKLLENWLIPKLKYVITVSDGIKNYYQKKYDIKVNVIRNLPIQSKEKLGSFNGVSKHQKIVLYQGSINIGRGLELMIEAIALLKNYTLVIAGNGDILEDLEKKVLNLQLENKVTFLGKLNPTELQKLTPNATVGLSLEEDLGLNYKYALPNKLFDYIQAEIPVIVSNLSDMAGIVNQYKVGEVLIDRTPLSLSNLILKIGTNNYTAQLKNAKKELTWENEKATLLNLLDSVS